MFWGLSPALDLQEELCCDMKDVINILLVGESDARHILKTMAQAYRHSQKKINFYILEGPLELVARQMLLLGIALENPQELGLLEKCIIFMEILGNILLRPSTAQYLANKAHHLVNMVTDLDYMSKMIPIFDLKQLKYKDRDYLEVIFKFWEKGTNADFNVCDQWDRRLRKYLGVRYDTRLGAFDWDYYMHLKPLVERVCVQEYKHFRDTGIAFTRLDAEGTKANLTLAAGVIENGLRVIHHGYMGDTLTGPFLTYGLNCEDKDMLKTGNNLNLKRATDITERNLRRMFYELETKEKYIYQPVTGEEKINQGCTIVATSEVKMWSDDSRHSYISECLQSIPIENVTITFLPFNAIINYPKRKMLQKYFDLIYISHCMLQHFKDEALTMAADGALLLLESRMCALGHSKDKRIEFGNEINKFAERNNCLLNGKFDPTNNFYAKFTTPTE